MDDHGTHDDIARRRLELPRRQPGEGLIEGEKDAAETRLLAGLARADVLGDEAAGGTPPEPDTAPIDASREAKEAEVGASRSEPDVAVGEDEPRPHFRTPEEMLAEQDWPELPGGGEIWDSAAAPGDDLATEDELAD